MEKILYDSNDMVKAGCNDCKGCFDCCCEMGNSIVLDPYDVFMLEKNLHCTFEMLLQDKIELQVVDGLILPNLKMQGETERCGFLNEQGRCSIHTFRPGLCRLFPLGRNYDDGEMKYFLLEDACQKAGHTKIKVKKWLDVPDLKRYEKFLIDWHYYRKKLQEEIAQVKTDETVKQINMEMLQLFYQMPYAEEDFYMQFEERLGKNIRNKKI
ncbi:MAG: YkgJ family cysteine cluster protein [Lachnospiraceae bacterium]|nr:YkgJ family cysteine cluster protein [Lachnospiraceae bacterium]